MNKQCIRLGPDEALQFEVTIVANQLNQAGGFIEYIVQVSHLPSSSHYGTLVELATLTSIELISWSARRRYTEFRNLKMSLQELSGINFAFPGKKITGNLDKEVIATRQKGLQEFLNEVLANPFLRTAIELKQFLDDASWTDNFQDLASQSVMTFCRSKGALEVGEILPQVGWRTRKMFFQQVRSNPETNSKEERFVVWGQLRLENQLSEKTMESLSRSLIQMEHPFLSELEDCALSNSGGVFVRRFNPAGSLRDVMHASKPRNAFVKKYAKTQSVRTFPEDVIRVMSWQILHGLSFLHARGLGHGNLTTSNIHFQEGRAKIASFENFFLGLPGFLRPLAVQLQQPSKSLANFDVYCFGHVLFELSTGYPLNCPILSQPIENKSDEMNSLIWSILSDCGVKSPDYPTFESLLHHPWFNPLRSTSFERPHLKFSLSTKEVVAKVKERVEEKLWIDHKLFKDFMLNLRRQSLLNSDSERRKRQLMRANRSNQPPSCPNAVPTSVDTWPIPNSAQTRPLLEANQGQRVFLSLINGFKSG